MNAYASERAAAIGMRGDQHRPATGVVEPSMMDDQAMALINFPGGSMYEMLFPGGIERAIFVLVLLGGFNTATDAGRVRDGWIETDPSEGYTVRLVTRNGGGNRASYSEQINRLRNHPLYLRDEDHPFDSTYASFWFRTPARTNRTVLAMVARDPVVFDKDHWDKAMAEHLRLLADPAQARHPSVQASRELMVQLKHLFDSVLGESQEESPPGGDGGDTP